MPHTSFLFYADKGNTAPSSVGWTDSLTKFRKRSLSPSVSLVGLDTTREGRYGLLCATRFSNSESGISM